VEDKSYRYASLRRRGLCRYITRGITFSNHNASVGFTSREYERKHMRTDVLNDTLSLNHVECIHRLK
jgi:hypothetical protein